MKFLNTLTQAQADARKHTGSSYRYAITGSTVGSYATSSPFVGMNYIAWADGAASADWAGLRPLSELEFEKAARGPLSPLANEYAWGSTGITQATGLMNTGTATETPTPAGANAAYGNSAGVQGPVRASSFAAPGSKDQEERSTRADVDKGVEVRTTWLIGSRPRVFRWVLEPLGEHGFRPWRPFDHPQLGPVKVGGMVYIWTYQRDDLPSCGG